MSTRCAHRVSRAGQDSLSWAGTPPYPKCRAGGQPKSARPCYNARMHAAHNARVQLLATLLNNLALSFIVAGFVAPIVSGQLHPGWHAFVTPIWIACGLGLHYVGRVARGFRE